MLKPGNVNDAQIPTWVGDNATAIAQVIDDSRWLPDENYLTTGNILLYYFRAFYFATCNLTGLGAAVVPYKVSAVCFTLGCFIMGVMVFAYLTSAIVTLVMQADAAADNFKNTTMQLLSFMKDAGIEHDVTMRSSKWLNQWWFAHGGTNINNIMDKLPPTLSSEIRAHCFMTAAKQSSFWVSQTDQSEVVSYEDMFRLAQDIRFEVYNHGEYVLRKGMLNDYFYVVAFGSLEVMLEDNATGGSGGGMGHAAESKRRRSVATGIDLSSKVIAQIDVGGEEEQIIERPGSRSPRLISTQIPGCCWHCCSLATAGTAPPWPLLTRCARPHRSLVEQTAWASTRRSTRANARRACAQRGRLSFCSCHGTRC